MHVPKRSDKFPINFQGVIYINLPQISHGFLINVLANSSNSSQLVLRSQMGTCLFSGDGLRRDVTKSAAWFRKAAEQGAAGQNATGSGWEVRRLVM